MKYYIFVSLCDNHTVWEALLGRKKKYLSRDHYSSQIYAKPEWNLSKLKFFDELFKRKFKNLAKKLSDFDKNLITKKTICVDLLVKISDFDEILTSKSTQMVFLVVKFSSRSDNFLAKFLNFLLNSSLKYFNRKN